MNQPDSILNGDNAVVDIAFVMRTDNPDLPYKPPFPVRYGSFVLTADVIGREDLLVQYYRDIKALLKKRRMSLITGQHYFWIRPLIFDEKQKFAFIFPWNDTLDEAVQILECLKADGDEELYWDIDQGWEFKAWAKNGNVYIQEGNPDELGEKPDWTEQDKNEVYTTVRFDASILRSKIEAATPRAGSMVSLIEKKAGRVPMRKAPSLWAKFLDGWIRDFKM